MRYCVYIDGFNMYYALKKQYRQFLWLNYNSLAKQLLAAKDTLVNVVYFSALVYWKPDDVKVHEEFIKAQKWAGVEVVLGKFREKEITCHLCHKKFRTHEEKRTDVSLGVRVVADAAKDVYDRAVLVTADSDLIPSIHTVRSLFPNKDVGVLFPIGKVSYDLKAAAGFCRWMPQIMLERCLLPAVINQDGLTVVKPSNWP